MSLRLEMLQVARLAPAVLGEGADLIEAFVRARQHPDGGFRDRDGGSDIYYSVFAVDALTALQVEPPNLTDYLKHSLAEDLDFIHRCSLLRLHSIIAAGSSPPEEALAAVEAQRTPDGGYNETPGAETASAYGTLLGYAAYADHGMRPADEERLLDAIAPLAKPDGGFANDQILPISAAPSTAAAITLHRQLGVKAPDGAGDFLLSCYHPQGGFRPFPSAPMPDLLSTAVTLHALDGLEIDFSKLKDPLLDFVDSLWVAEDGEGGFFGTWDDELADLEYTYYGLLALGHLAL